MEHMKIFVMENPFSPTRCKKIAHIHFIYFKSMIQNHHNPRHTFQTFSLTTYVFLMLVVRALESYLILDKGVEIFLQFYDRWFRRVTFRYKEVISLVTTSETNDDNTLVLFSTRPQTFLIAFGSLITNFYPEKKILLSHEKKKLRSRHVSRGMEKLISTLCFPNIFALVIQRGLPRCLFSFFS